MPLFVHKIRPVSCTREDLDLMEEAAQRVEQEGIEAWFALPTCANCSAWKPRLRQGQGHAGRVVRLRGDALPPCCAPPGCKVAGRPLPRRLRPASRLVPVVAAGGPAPCDGNAPYKTLLTHGFVVDGQGRKMSKSLGNVDRPAGQVMKRSARRSSACGSPRPTTPAKCRSPTRSWKRVVGELPPHPQHAALPARQHRPTSTPATDALPVEQWLEIDRYALAMTRRMAEAAAADYSRFEFHLVVQRLQTFCSEDLGGFWLDVLKDRLYTCARGSAARRSAQSALHHVTQVLLRLMAPILSFTAEEAWAVLHPGRDESVFFHTWEGVLPAQAGEDALVAKWSRLREIRAAVQKNLEELRQSGGIGSSLQAEVAIAAPEGDRILLESLGEDLRFVMITSAATVEPGAALAVRVAASTHAKCDRCWHFREDVGADPRHPAICGRCVSNVEGAGEVRRHA
jgi:isoleucyl-tRNA synthetase